MKNKKGFTLIELLAVIVILAIIMVIAVPKILDVIENSRRTAAIESAQFFIEAVNTNNQLASTSLDIGYELYRDGKYNVSYVKNTLKLKNTWPSDNSIFRVSNGKVKTACLKVNNYNISCDGKWCNITDSECENAAYGGSGDYTYHYQVDGGHYLQTDYLPSGINFYGKEHKETGAQEVCLIASGGEICLEYGHWDCGDVENGECSNKTGYIWTKLLEAQSKGASISVDGLQASFSYNGVSCTNPYTGCVYCYDPDKYMCRINEAGGLFCRNPF